MPKPVMVSVSGIRGIVGDGLSPDLVARYSAAAGTLTGPGEVMVGRDSRVTGPMVMHAVFSGLMSVGCHPVDLGLVPTPTVQLATEKSDAVGGIVITASHNPVEWNALKLLGRDGLFLDEHEGAEVKRIVEQGRFRFVPWDAVGRQSARSGAVEDHIRAVLAIPFVDVEAVRRRGFRVAYDCVNGAGGVLLPGLLSRLGCEAFPIHAEPHGRFAHAPEPVAANLADLCRLVREHRADIGFAVDPDADRLAVVAETGQAIGEEYTVTLAVRFILSKRNGRVAVNISTTRAVDDVAKASGAEVIRTPVGEIHVAKKMREIKASIGGEGNGGVILPDVHLGRDAAVGVALILQQLLESGGTLSALWKSLPQYTMVKKKMETGRLDPDGILRRFEEKHLHERIDRTDGLKIERPEGWVQVRKSNTEPIIRVMAEAKTARAAEELCDSFLRDIKGLLHS
jgi:phosphomannomutase